MTFKVPFAKPDIGEEEIEAVNRVLRSGWLAAGPETEAFEKEFADYVGAKYAIFTNSCTSALKIAYKWLSQGEHDIPWGDNYRVAYPANTFCATYSAAREMGLSICTHDHVINYRTQRVNVHYGSVKDKTPCIIEDSAHRIEPKDRFVGKIKCYSFYVTKNMTTGSGGMFVTNDKEIYDYARLCWKDGLSTSTADRLNGRVGYEVKLMAGGYDGNDVAAAMGRVQLKRLPEFTARRNEIVGLYNQAFGKNWTGNHLYPYFVSSEEQVYPLIDHLKEKGIQASHHYPGTGWLGVSIPLYPLMTDEQVQYVIDSVKEFK